MSLGAWACSQGDPQPPLIPDPPTSDASSGGGDVKTDVAKQVCSADDGGCNALVNCAPHVDVNEVAQNPPAATGGTVPDGTYLLTGYQIFTGPSGSTGQNVAWFSETMTFATSAANDAGASDGGGEGGASQDMVWEDIIQTNANPTATSVSGVAQFSGTNVEITHTCPNSNLFDGTYTVSSTQLILYATASTGTAQLTYTKQ